MVKPRKKVSNPPNYVSLSTTRTKVNQSMKAPLFVGNFDILEERMMNFLNNQGIEFCKSMILDSMMYGESKEHNTREMKGILNGQPYCMNANFEECSLGKFIWDKLHDLHSK